MSIFSKTGPDAATVSVRIAKDSAAKAIDESLAYVSEKHRK